MIEFADREGLISVPVIALEFFVPRLRAFTAVIVFREIDARRKEMSGADGGDEYPTNIPRNDALPDMF